MEASEDVKVALVKTVVLEVVEVLVVSMVQVVVVVVVVLVVLVLVVVDQHTVELYVDIVDSTRDLVRTPSMFRTKDIDSQLHLLGYTGECAAALAPMEDPAE